MKQIGVILVIMTTLAIFPHGKAGQFYSTKDQTVLYIDSEFKFNWQEAKDECIKRKMSLVTVDSETKKQQLQDVIKSLNLVDHLGFWIGGHKNQAGDEFEWIHNHEPFEYTNWQKGEPNNALKSEDCLMFYTDTLNWNDFICKRKLGYVCEYISSSNKETVEAAPITEGPPVIGSTSQYKKSLNTNVKGLEWTTKSGELDTTESPISEALKNFYDVEDDSNYDESSSEMVDWKDIHLKESYDKLKSQQNNQEKLEIELKKMKDELQSLKTSFDLHIQDTRKELALLRRTIKDQAMLLRVHQSKWLTSKGNDCTMKSNHLLNGINDELSQVKMKQDKLFNLFAKSNEIPIPSEENENSSTLFNPMDNSFFSDIEISNEVPTLSEENDIYPTFFNPMDNSFFRDSIKVMKDFKRSKQMFTSPLYQVIMNHYDYQKKPFRL
ncbi:uncharacterized protein LOC142226924 [Haematobia irritans]|uniref:uncharacterized protein LOC142226924 n=1 Tax=Haematobia irritans TaxID=7368 RepID=UPI003F504711